MFALQVNLVKSLCKDNFVLASRVLRHRAFNFIEEGERVRRLLIFHQAAAELLNQLLATLVERRHGPSYALCLLASPTVWTLQRAPCLWYTCRARYITLHGLSMGFQVKGDLLGA